LTLIVRKEGLVALLPVGADALGKLLLQQVEMGVPAGGVAGPGLRGQQPVLDDECRVAALGGM
jgi:hypothetical protein